MAGWMINCKEYAELTSQNMDRPLTFWDRISLKVHEWICPPCLVIRKQFDTMRSVCRFSPEDENGDIATHLSDEACERMKSAIRQASNDKEAP